MINRSILIITPFFAPQSHAAVFRAYKLAKYLPHYGWKPYVVTTNTNYLYNEDPGLLDALPPEVEICRTRYVEPSLRGLRMALGGKDRTFKAIKAAGELPQTSPAAPNPRQSVFGWASSFYKYLLDAWLQSPDAYWTWEKPTVQKAAQLIHEHHIPIVFTSADPYTSHRIGYQLQQKTNLRWIADFRDPHTHSFGMHSHHERVYRKQRQAEESAARHADAVTVAAESIALILTETYGLNTERPIHFIPTGLDESLLNAGKILNLPPYPYWVFVGEFLAGYSEEFFRVFSRVVDNPKVAETGVKLLFIGRKDVNAPLLTPLLKKYGLERHAELIDHLPQEALYQYLQGAKAALLIFGKRAAWWRLSAKLVDYIALRKPVIAVVPDPSEARTHLQRSGLGIFLDGDEAGMVDLLTDFILRDHPLFKADPDYCERFLAQKQVSQFAELFESLLSQ